MSVRLANSTAITVSIGGNGVNNDFLDILCKYLKSRFGPMMCYAVIEDNKKGVPHLHFQCWFESDRNIDDVRKTYIRMLKKVYGEPSKESYIMEHALHVDGAFNGEFALTYLQKDIKREVFNNVCLKKLNDFEYSWKIKETSEKKTVPQEISFYQSLNTEDKKNPFSISLALSKFAINNGCPRKDKLQNILNYAILQVALEDENDHQKYYYWSKIVNLQGTHTKWDTL